VLLSEPPGPDTRSKVFQWLRLPDALKRVPHDRLDKVQEASSDPSLGTDPMTKILAKLLLEDCGPGRCHGLLGLLEAELPPERFD